MSFRHKHGDRPVDGYTILRGIGKGGFGEVYYAVSDGGREVALKLLYQGQDIELRGVGHCMNLKCPHLVTIFDVRRAADGTPCILMEPMAGPSLRGMLAGAPAGLGPAVAAYLVKELCRGLAYLHERDIVHRDLKPENIFVEQGRVKIGDYSLSKHISITGGSCHTISVGTVHYMAPEIGSGRYHRGIDIYALGILFYELLTGSVPFTGSSVAEIVMKHVTAEPDYDRVPATLVPVLRKALAKSPEARYSSADLLLADLEAIPEAAAWMAEVRPESLSRLALALPRAETIALGSPPPAPPGSLASAAALSPAASPGRSADASAARTEPAGPSSGARRLLHPVARVLLVLAGAILLITSGLLLFLGGDPYDRSGALHMDPYCTGGAALAFVYFLLAVRLAWAAEWPGALRATRLFILTSLLALLAAGGVFYGVLWDAHRRAAHGDLHVAFVLGFFALLLGWLGWAAVPGLRSRWRAWRAG